MEDGRSEPHGRIRRPEVKGQWIEATAEMTFRHDFFLYSRRLAKAYADLPRDTDVQGAHAKDALAGSAGNPITPKRQAPFRHRRDVHPHPPRRPAVQEGGDVRAGRA